MSGSEPLRCVALVGKVRSYWKGELRPGPFCGGPVIETEGGPCANCNHDHVNSFLGDGPAVACTDLSYDDYGRPDEPCECVDYVAPLVHVEQDGECTATFNGSAACGRLASHRWHQVFETPEILTEHAHVPRIIPDSEAGHAVQVDR